MAAKNIEFKVGLFILIGAAIVVVSLYWLEGMRLSQNIRSLQVKFNDVGTLAIGDRVTVSGVHKGKVDDLQLTPYGVLVELHLERDVKLWQDAEIVIKNQGLMGERFVAIKPGTDTLPPLDASKPLDGEYDAGLPEVMGLLGEMTVELRELVASLNQTVGSEGALNRVGTILENLEQVSTTMSRYLHRNEQMLDSAAQNFFYASKKLNSMVNRNAPHVDSSLARIDRASASVEELVYRLDSVSITARAFARALEENDGSLQLLVEDRRLYDDLRQAADNIDDLVNDIRANPRKYINLTVEIF
ncbi:MCE family protein [candidate division GN15 bacterium]|nr:MCE family protein [candidate division GN15 bacterium]